MKNNICCRIFKEQIDLILQLPEQERAEVLYKAVLSAFNQIENQNDNQIENQNENAYVSVSDNISVLSKTVYILLSKNIVCKEFSNNYGGKRINAGRPKNQIDNQVEKQTKTIQETKNIPHAPSVSKFTPPTLSDVLQYAKEQSSMIGVGGFSCPQKIAEEFWTHYDSQGWVKSNDAKTPVTNWKSLLRSWTLNPNKFSKVGAALPPDYDLPL